MNPTVMMVYSVLSLSTLSTHALTTIDKDSILHDILRIISQPGYPNLLYRNSEAEGEQYRPILQALDESPRYMDALAGYLRATKRGQLKRNSFWNGSGPLPALPGMGIGSSKEAGGESNTKSPVFKGMRYGRRR